MTELSAIISVLNLLGLGGVGVFIYYLFKGLTQKIKTLTEISKEQEKTLAVVRERALEMDKWRKEYKEMVTDFQELGAKLDTRRNELVRELEDANKKKDAEVADLKTAQLREIELRQKSYQKAQELEKELKSARAEFEKQLQIVQPWELGKEWAKYVIDVPSLSSTDIKFADFVIWPELGGKAKIIETKQIPPKDKTEDKEKGSADSAEQGG